MALAGWTRRVKLTVPAANVSGIIPDFPVLVTRDCLPDEVCDPSSPNAAQVGGGDLRVTLTDNTVIPLEIAAFGHDSSSGAGDAQVRLWFLAPLLSTSGDKEFYLYYNAETTQSQPSVTDPTGRNAVWADFHRVYHLDEETGDFVDSTGSSADGVLSGTVTRGVAVGALKGVDFGATGHTNYIDAPSLGDQSTTFAVSCWVDLDATQGNWCGIVADGDDVGNGGIVVQREFNTNDLRVYYNGLEYYNDLTSAFSSIIGVGDTILHVAVTPDSLINVYKNASNIATDSTQESSAAAATTPTLKIGNARNGGNGIGGVIAELRIRPGALTFARMEAERDNQSLPATFISPGTPEAVSAGAVSVDLAPGALAFTGAAAQAAAGQAPALAAGSLALSGQTLEVLAGEALEVGIAPGALTLTGAALSLTAGGAVALALGPGALGFSAAALSLSAGARLELGPGSLGLAGQAASAAAGQARALGPGSLTLSGAALAVQVGTAVPVSASIGPGSLSLAGQGLNVAAGALTVLGPASLTLTGQTLTLAAGGAVRLDLGAGTLSLAGAGFEAVAGLKAALQAGALTWTGQALVFDTGGPIAIDSARLVTIQAFDRLTKVVH